MMRAFVCGLRCRSPKPRIAALRPVVPALLVTLLVGLTGCYDAFRKSAACQQMQYAFCEMREHCGGAPASECEDDVSNGDCEDASSSESADCVREINAVLDDECAEVPRDLRCPTSLFSAEGEVCAVSSECAEGLLCHPDDRVCQAPPEDCPANSTLGADGLSCECDDGYVDTGGACVEPEVCGANESLGADGVTCECDDGFVRVGDSCQEDNGPCGANASFDDDTMQCICNPGAVPTGGPDCELDPEGYCDASGGDGSSFCDPTASTCLCGEDFGEGAANVDGDGNLLGYCCCPDGFIHEGFGVCEECGPNMHADDGSCICDDGHIPDPNGGAGCVVGDPDCPENSQWNGTTCECDSGYRYDAGSETCIRVPLVGDWAFEFDLTLDGDFNPSTTDDQVVAHFVMNATVSEPTLVTYAEVGDVWEATFTSGDVTELSGTDIELSTGSQPGDDCVPAPSSGTIRLIEGTGEITLGWMSSDGIEICARRPGFFGDSAKPYVYSRDITYDGDTSPVMLAPSLASGFVRNILDPSDSSFGTFLGYGPVDLSGTGARTVTGP